MWYIGGGYSDAIEFGDWLVLALRSSFIESEGVWENDRVKLLGF